MADELDTQTLLKRAYRRSVLTFDQTLTVLKIIGWKVKLSEEMMSLRLNLEGKPARTGRSTSYQEYERYQKRAVAKLPSVAQAKSKTYVLNLSEPESYPSGYVHFTCEEWRKHRVAKITSPARKSHTMVDSREITKGPHRFWYDAFEEAQTDLRRLLGIDPNEEGKRKPKAGQLLGTCPVCESEQVIHNGKMVLHGYRRPGHGWIVGRCFGVNRLAYNLSADGCVAYGEWLAKYLRDVRKRLRALKADKVEAFTIPHRSLPDVIVRRGEDGFDDAREQAISDTERTIRQVGDAIKRMATMVANWKGRPLRKARSSPDGG